MRVKELKKILEGVSDDAMIGVAGCYGSFGLVDDYHMADQTTYDAEGRVAKVCDLVVLHSDICSG